MVFVLAVTSAITAAVKYSGKRKRAKEAKNSEDLLQQGIDVSMIHNISINDDFSLSMIFEISILFAGSPIEFN